MSAALAPEQALLRAWESHQRAKPDVGDYPHFFAWEQAMTAWIRRHDELRAALQQRDIPIPPEAEPQEPDDTKDCSEESMPQLPKALDPEERLDQLQVRLQQQVARGAAKLAYATKSAIRRHCGAHGLAVPVEALPKVRETGEQPAEAATRPAPHPAPAPPAAQGLGPVLEGAIDLGRAIERQVSPSAPPVDHVRARVRGLRRQVLLMMADLEALPDLAKADLLSDLALLDALAHGAHQLACGRLEVA